MRNGVGWWRCAVPTLVAGVVISACHADASDSQIITCDRQPPLDWDNFGGGFLTLHCTECHSVLKSEPQRSGAPTGINFDTYSDVVRHVALIELESTGADPAMPPSGGPTSDELTLFREWLTCAVWPDHEALEANGKL
jgi:uncharacterized membrane protein